MPIYAKSVGIKKVYVLNDKQTYGFGVATTYKNAAKKIGLQVVGFKGWDAKQSSYEALANAIKQSGARGCVPRRYRVQQRREAHARTSRAHESEDQAGRCRTASADHERRTAAVANGAFISVAGSSAGPAEGRRSQTFVKSFGKQIGTHAEPVRRVRRAGHAA